MARRAVRTLTVYQAEDGFRWHLKYNGLIVSESGQAYDRRPTALRQARQYGVPAGDFPVVLIHEKRTGGRSAWVREVLR